MPYCEYQRHYISENEKYYILWLKGDEHRRKKTSILVCEEHLEFYSTFCVVHIKEKVELVKKIE